MRKPRRIKRKPNKDQQLLQVLYFINRVKDQDVVDSLRDEIEAKQYELLEEKGGEK